MRGRIFLSSPPTSLDAHSQSALNLPFPVTPLLPRSLLTGCLDSKAASAHRRPRPWHLAVQTISGGIGISTDCPSPTAFALGLGPTNPERINLPQETLDIRRARFSRAFRYSCRHSHFRPLQPSSRSTFTADGTLPYQTTTGEPVMESVASVPSLSPAEFSAQIHLTSELLRTLSMMAASKPTSWLSERSNILSHLAWISGP